MSENITAALADPILGLIGLFRADDRPEKINLGIGVYEDETGKTPVLTSIKKAEQYPLEDETTEDYLGIDDIPEFDRCTQGLLLGKGNTIIADKRAHTAQIPGGTGVLRVTANFLTKSADVKHVWVSNPSRSNRKSVFISVGLEVHEYTYYDAVNHTLDFEGLLVSLAEAQAGDVILFHGCYHNPTGINPTFDQWQQPAQLSVKKGWFPLPNFACQDFARGLEEDAGGLRTFAVLHKELLIANSYPKNFGLYNEHAGAYTLVATDQETVDHAFNQMRSVIRANYSNPPAYGVFVVATIPSNDALRVIWEQKLTGVHQRIQHMRPLLVDTLQEEGASRDFNPISQQNGMSSFNGLTKEQTPHLHEEFAVYTVASGHINVAGVMPDNMAPLYETIIAVL